MPTSLLRKNFKTKFKNKTYQTKRNYNSYTQPKRFGNDYHNYSSHSDFLDGHFEIDSKTLETKWISKDGKRSRILK